MPVEPQSLALHHQLLDHNKETPTLALVATAPPHAQTGAPRVPCGQSSLAHSMNAAIQSIQLHVHLPVILFWPKQSQRESLPSRFDRMGGPLLSQAPKSDRVHRGTDDHQFKTYRRVGTPTCTKHFITRHKDTPHLLVRAGQKWELLCLVPERG